MPKIMKVGWHFLIGSSILYRQSYCNSTRTKWRRQDLVREGA